jgi:uncharacterized protein
MQETVANCVGFEWDEGNSDKNWYLHEVNNGECEQVFFNKPLLLLGDSKHSVQESRAYALGKTDTNRWLSIAFTIRNDQIRVISARDMNQKETRKYAERVKTHSKFSK